MKTSCNKKKDKFVSVQFRCSMCGKIHYLKNITESQYHRVMLRRSTGEYIQNILPDLSPIDREKFISGLCDGCQILVFAKPEED